MSYKSIDVLQRSLASTIFSTKKDAKKAAGRALGTIVEMITYYLLREWGFTSNIQIETKLPEFGNPEITHNVEFTLHHSLQQNEMPVSRPLSYIAIKKTLGLDLQEHKTGCVLDSNGILKNSAIIGKNNNSIAICNLIENKLTLSLIVEKASALFECKRVGVEEGQKKGPQTIEKAKQGAYVALKSSSLQKVRDESGNMYGVYFKNGILYTKNYEEALDECIQSGNLSNFILSFGVVSNHGNWFTSDNMNKELKVLAQSYDRLLFLTDEGLYSFIEDTILKPQREYEPIKDAFISSYKDGKKINAFTKSKIHFDAHIALTKYFHDNINSIENWFNIISPNDVTMTEIKQQLHHLINNE